MNLNWNELLSADVLREQNAAVENSDAILVDINWTYKSENADSEFRILPSIVRMLSCLRELLQVSLYCAIPNEPIDRRRIIGLIIFGGADLHPKFYGEAIAGALLRPSSALRYPRTLAVYRWARDRVPILGICYGAQFIAVAEGGSLAQHIPNAEQHQKRYNAMRVAEGSWLRAAAQSDSFESWCNHHQGIKVLPSCFEVTMRDETGSIHGFERRGPKTVIGCITHIEYAVVDGPNANILKAFVAECKSQISI